MTGSAELLVGGTLVWLAHMAYRSISNWKGVDNT